VSETDTQFLAPALREEEDDFDRSLRPRRLDEFVGQERLKEQLEVALTAAKTRNEALDHVLLVGPPGLGKTSLARIIAEELDVPFVQTAGPALERKGDIAAFLTDLEPRSVFFVDEIHRLPRAVEETFYPAMEDRRLPVTLGVGPGARVVTLDLPSFTLVGATTRAGLLTTPLRDRFGIQHRLDHYEPGDLARIVVRSAAVLGVAVDAAGARSIADRARGTPRVANRLLKRVRDYAQVRGDGAIDGTVAAAALDLLEVDRVGLDRLDRELLRTICTRFSGGPVGLSTLAVAVHEEQDTIEDVYEPYLLQLGFLQRTPRGRVITDLGRAHIGSTRGDGSLF
jgi:Holliday junction DNA helicase RuvB